ncbi:hypothetical protein C8A05DRAFT_37285 [Staphylotrichum tortipilum]|uniref:CBM1 domain-containing protein n=1 Tax=Staphylotrichum tortipilum TaxID=2831512 RepID=A0AAN6MF82_9PEZI|nr:hypothetical protein C8A05DRAFT_37285 [Staphylotrichum longicolle]
MLSKTALFALALVPFSAAQVSSDFENGWDQTEWPTYANDCSQGGAVSLDSTTAHSGKNSIRVDGAGGYCGHMFFGTKKVPAGDFYVRVWLKAAKAFTDSHVTFITMPDPAQGTNKHLRIGGQSKILMYNRESDDATMPDLSPQGIAASTALPAGSWECFEYKIGADGSIATWLNGNAISGLTQTPGVSNANTAQWQRSSVIPKPSAVYFGWESYGGDTNTFWYDDVAVASSRIGCDGTGGGPGSSSSVVPSSTTKTTAVSSTTLVTSTTKTSSSAVVTTTTSVKTSSTTRSAPPTSSTADGCLAAKWAQCAGIGYTGCKACTPPSTCQYGNDWYSQCL